jgi:hypothetical protein
VRVDLLLAEAFDGAAEFVVFGGEQHGLGSLRVRAARRRS